MGVNLDRAALIELCERGFSPESTWGNRDSSSAHRQLGECYALLKAGCDFSVGDVSDNTLWVRITYRGFDYFEGDYDGPGSTEDDTFYVPTAERLDRAAGRDWY